MFASHISPIQQPSQGPLCVRFSGEACEFGLGEQCLPVNYDNNSENKMLSEVDNLNIAQGEDSLLKLAKLFRLPGVLNELPHNYAVGIAPFCVITKKEIVAFVESLGLDLPEEWNKVVNAAEHREDRSEFMMIESEK